MQRLPIIRNGIEATTWLKATPHALSKPTVDEMARKADIKPGNRNSYVNIQ